MHPDDHDQLRRQIAADVQAYLDGGGQITQVPYGASADDPAITQTQKQVRERLKRKRRHASLVDA